MTDKSKNRGASPIDGEEKPPAPTVAEGTGECEVSGHPIGDDGILAWVARESGEVGGEGFPCPGCEMEADAKVREPVMEPRQIEVLMAFANGTLEEVVDEEFAALRMLGLIDRIYAASYTGPEGWQLLDAGEAMVRRITAANKAISSRAVPSAEEIRDFMASRIGTGLPELDRALKGGIPKDKVAEVWGRAEVPEPEEDDDE